MAVIDDRRLAEVSSKIEVVNAVGRRRITHVFHDVDGTHSLIRQWPPIMSAAVHWAMNCGLDEDFDSAENLSALANRLGRERSAETDAFCVESAGLSALTQMEYAIRRAVELGNIPRDAPLRLTEQQRKNNSEICRRIWAGQERFDDLQEPRELLDFIGQRAPRLFRFYETLLNRACRDRNTEQARRDPASWRVPGSLDFLSYLREIGCVNVFVTGSVLYEDGGMLEEVQTLGYPIGPGRMVEAILGSAWDRKIPKLELMRQLVSERGVAPDEVLAVGDGRAEIEAGTQMGGIAMSRLPADAARARELHRSLGTNYILEDFTDGALRQLLRRE